MKIAGIMKHSFVDGPGIRYVIFFQGCGHNCKGCQNPETHDINNGESIEVSKIIEDFRSTKLIDGITLSGGDPMLQPQAIVEIAKAAKQDGLTVWCYTGYKIENLLNDMFDLDIVKALYYIDVLVDGPFVESLKPEDSTKCLYRGSTNQRIIDVKETLKTHMVTLLDI